MGSCLMAICLRRHLPKSKVFYHKMKADYYRYIAEFKTDDAKKAAAENARKAYDDASNIASAGLPVTHPIRAVVSSYCKVWNLVLLTNEILKSLKISKLLMKTKFTFLVNFFKILFNGYLGIGN